jgi:hypothetical protein
MSFLLSPEISEITDERTRISKDLEEAKNTAAQLYKHSSQIVQGVAGVETSEQIPAQLTDVGTPPAELAAALALLQAEFAKIDEAQKGIRDYEGQIQKEKEKRRELIICVGVAAIVVLAFLVGMVLSKQKPAPTEQALTVPPTSASRQVTAQAPASESGAAVQAPTDSATTAVQEKPPSVSTLKPESEPATVTHGATSISSSLPLEATPAAVTEDKKPLAIDFLIESIGTGEATIRFNITIRRNNGSNPLPWSSDEGRKDEIYLTAGSQRYKLIEMGGLFTQNATLQPGQSYTGWLTFEKPDRDIITFYYPDVEPLHIDLSKLEIGASSSADKTISPSAPQTLLEDSFDDNHNKWGLYTKDDAASAIAGGKLSISIDTKKDLTAWTSPAISVSDFVLEVDALFEQGADNHAYGVLVRKQDDDNFYQFAYSQNTFSIWKYKGGEWLALQDWTPSKAVRKPGETNRLKIVAKGDRFEFYANNELLASRNDASFTDGKIGLMAAIFDSGKAKVTFDNLVIYRDEVAAAQATIPTPRAPTSTPVPPTPTPLKCPTVTGLFANLWQRHKTELGCPLKGWESDRSFPPYTFGEQPFQKGHMFFFQGEAPTIVVTYGSGGSGWTGRGTWEEFPSTWKEGEPDFSCAQERASPEQPTQSFGRVWCENPQVRQGLGWGIDRPRDQDRESPGANVYRLQRFDNGFIFRDSDGWTNKVAFVFFNGNKFVRESYR